MRDIEAGHYNVACVLGLELMRNVNGQTGAEYLGAARWIGHEADNADFPWPHMFDRITREYDKRYGINSEHLNTIAEINFCNAKQNPYAQSREWHFPEGCFSNNDKLNPVIDGAVRKMDCGQITDGAACIILAGKSAAKNYAARNGLSLADIPRVKGWGHHSAPILLETKLQLSADQPLLFPHAKATLDDARQRAGFKALTDLDGMETHDCFTVTEYMAIDHSGLTAPGESWESDRRRPHCQRRQLPYQRQRRTDWSGTPRGRYRCANGTRLCQPGERTGGRLPNCRRRKHDHL